MPPEDRRAELLASIPRRYNGYAHLALMHLLALDAPRPWDWLLGTGLPVAVDQDATI